MGNYYYPKSGGSAGSKGVEYQVNLLTTILINALLQLKGSPWKLSTEHKEAGKFDDVVFEGPDGDVLLQAKSKENKTKRITLDDLLSTSSKNDDFSLPKYFSSYLQIRDQFRIRNLIICTNAEVHEKALVFLDSHHQPQASLLHCKNDYSYYTFNTNILSKFNENMHKYLENNAKLKSIEKEALADSQNIQEFFEKLQFYHSYPPEYNFSQYIEQLLTSLKCSSSLFHKVSFQDVHNKVKKWFEDPRGEYLTESRAITFFCEIRSTRYYETLDNYNVLFTSNESKTDRKQVSLITIETEFLLHVLRVHQSLKHNHIEILYAYLDDGADIQRQIMEAFGNSKCTTLVIICPTATEESATEVSQQLQETLHRKSYKKVILITKSDNALRKQIVSSNKDNCEEVESLVAFNNFAKETRNRLLKVRTICFQGASINLEELLPVAEINLQDYLCHKTLIDLVKGIPILIGSKVPVLKEDVQRFYVTRKLKRRINNEEVIYSEEDIYGVNEKMILITDCAGMGKSTALMKLAAEIKENHQHLWVIRIDLTTCSKNLRRALDSQCESIDIEELLDTPLNTEFKKSVFSIEGKLVLLLDGVDEISPHYTNLVVNLLVECQKASNFAKVFFTTRPHVSEELEKKLRVIPFMFQPFTEEDQIKFLSYYWALNLGQEDSNKNRCETYAKLLLNKVSAWIRSYGWEDHFTGIPLLLRMLAEIFLHKNKSLNVTDEWEGCQEFLNNNSLEPNLPKKMNLSKLYEMFVEKKRDVFLDKENPGGSTGANLIFNKQFDECLECHEALAVEHIFGVEVCQHFKFYRQQNYNMEILLKIGIAQEWNGEYQFIHRTWAEYFVATSLVKELQNTNAAVEFKHFLIYYLVENSGSWDNKVLEFFDSCLEEVVESLPCDVFCNYASEIYEIDVNTFKGSMLIIYNLVEKNRLFILEFLLKVLSDSQEPQEKIKRDERNFVKDFLKVHFEEQSKEGKVRGNLFVILRLLIKQNGINIIYDDEHHYYGGTPLHIASREGHLDMMKLLLDYGANICIRDIWGSTVLIVAAEYGRLDIVKFLVKHIGPNGVDINSQNDDGNTALHTAVLNNHPEIFKFLVDNDANINIKNKKGNTVLHEAASCGFLDIVNYLLNHGVEMNAENENGETALHFATWNNFPKIVELLVEKRADINSKNKYGNTALHGAASSGFLDILKFLIEHGANASIKNEDDSIPLHFAANNKFPDIVKLLMERNADVDTKNKFGNTALHRAASSGSVDIVQFLAEHGAKVTVQNEDDDTPLHLAAENKFQDIVEFLVARGADVNTKSKHGNTALHEAAYSGCLDIVKFLVEQGAKVDIKNKDDDFPLHLAAIKKFPDIVKFLVEKGTDVNTKNKYGNTPLQLAAYYGSLEIVDYLLEHGADVDNKNEDDDSPLHFAALNKFPEVVKTLTKKGADFNAKNKRGDTVLHVAVSSGCFDTVKFIVEQGVSVDIKNESGYTPLLNAVSGQFLEITKILVDYGADVNDKVTHGYTMLHAAAFHGYLDIVNFLLERGIKVDTMCDDGYTPLFLAVMGNFPQTVEVLLEKGADTNIKCKFGDTALHEAASSGSLDIVKFLVEHGAEVDIQNENRITPLHLAAENKFTEIVEFLVDKGAAINIKNKYGNTALHKAASFRSLDIAKFLVEHRAKIDIQNEDGWTPLHFASANKCTDIVQFLVERGAEFNIKNKYGNTALHEAASSGCLDIVKYLVEHGAKIRIQNDNRSTPLHIAAANKFTDIVQFLVKKGVDVNTKNRYRNTALHEAASSDCLDTVKFLVLHGARVGSRNKNRNSSLHFAAVNKSTDVIEFLVDKGVDINTDNKYGNTALHRAASSGYLDNVKFLVQHGAKVNVQNRSQITPLHLVAKNKFPDIARFLVDKGADVNTKSKYGNTALHEAASSGCLDIVKLLVEHGADVEIQNENDSTPLHLAVENKFPDVIDFLVEVGDDINIKNKHGNSDLFRWLRHCRNLCDTQWNN